MLLGTVVSATGDAPKLKPFSHFTLGCTSEDEASKITGAFGELTKFLRGPVTLQAKRVVNLGSETQPLWGVELDVDPSLRTMFSTLFDPTMCPERNGTLYSWAGAEPSAKKCPHVTLGPNDDDLRTARRLLDCTFTFSALDYKKVGPHDPQVSISL
jgi:hypothetical protein